MGSDKRRLAFKILHSTAEDLKKLERCAEGDECSFLVYVFAEEEQTVYGFAITAKNHAPPVERGLYDAKAGVPDVFAAPCLGAFEGSTQKGGGCKVGGLDVA